MMGFNLRFQYSMSVKMNLNVRKIMEYSGTFQIYSMTKHLAKGFTRTDDGQIEMNTHAYETLLTHSVSQDRELSHQIGKSPQDQEEKKRTSSNV